MTVDKWLYCVIPMQVSAVVPLIVLLNEAEVTLIVVRIHSKLE